MIVRISKGSFPADRLDAAAMGQLAPMLAQRPIMEAAGVTFETITNHETLWSITP